MKKIIDSNYLKAIIGVILLSVFSHIVIIVLFSLVNMEFTQLNLFKILDLDLFFPQVSKGLSNFIWSYLFLGVEYLLIFYFLKKK